MATTFKCDKCGTMFRTSSPLDFEEEKSNHKKICDGNYESIWKNYDNMTDKEIEMAIKSVIFKQGKITQ